MYLFNVFLLLLCMLIVCGCKGKTDANNTNNKKHPDQESSVGTFVDGITGRSSVKAGQKAKKEIERISSQERKALDEVLEK